MSNIIDLNIKKNDQDYNNLLFKIKNIYKSFQDGFEKFNSKLYWKIGKEILDMQAKCAWGEKVIYQLAEDLENDFKDLNVFTVNNLKNMRKFAHLFRNEFIENPLFFADWKNVQAFLKNIKNGNLAMLNVAMIKDYLHYN
jgi:hypothetical protein